MYKYLVFLLSCTNLFYTCGLTHHMYRSIQKQQKVTVSRTGRRAEDVDEDAFDLVERRGKITVSMR